MFKKWSQYIFLLKFALVTGRVPKIFVLTFVANTDTPLETNMPHRRPTFLIGDRLETNMLIGDVDV